METTFMTIHNLSPDATVLFASESIIDVLKFQPHEVVGRSCFDYFHPDDIPDVKKEHTRGVNLDKAAMLNYTRIRDRNNNWVDCECVFTVVYDVLVACTSIYREGMKQSQRATFDAPYVRHLFSSSPRDPRYHMLQHLSPKFENAPNADREPRAALILNRFSQGVPVMFATDSVAAILGLTAAQLAGKSFYELMQERCMDNALRCLESAKANDSIAYLRFFSRDPRRPEDIVEEHVSDAGSPESEDGGVELPREEGSVPRQSNEPSAYSSDGAQGGPSTPQGVRLNPSVSSGSVATNRSGSHISRFDDYPSSRASSSTDFEHDAAAALSEVEGSRSSTSSLPAPAAAAQNNGPLPVVEVEAVVSCTSDGLVVILRRARPIIPARDQTLVEMQQGHGVFAAPWGAYQDIQPQPTGPPLDNLMNAIRDVAVFAWGLVGINGNIAQYGHGTPAGEAMPRALPIWDPRAAGANLALPPHNQAQEMWHPWSGRDNQRDVPNQSQPSHGHGQRDAYRFDDLAPSATVARARMWQARQGSHGEQVRDAYTYLGRWDGLAGSQPIASAEPAVPSMQQFNADADAGGNGRAPDTRGPN